MNHGQLAPITATGCPECDKPGCACALKARLAAAVAPTLKVKFFDPAASRAGKHSIKSRSFLESERAQAEAFAATHVLYGRPSRVEVVSL